MNSRPNIILIILDTFRKDHFIKDRNINKLRNESFIFYDNVISPSPWTAPSHASIFTGVYPAIHGTHIYRDRQWTNDKIKAGAKNLFFANILKILGYNMYLLSANPHISPIFGYTGFDYILNIDPYLELIYKLNWDEEGKLKELMLKHKFNKIEAAHEIIKMHEYKFLLRSILYSLSKRHWNYNLLFKYLYYVIKKWPMEKGVSDFINILKNMKVNYTSPYFLFMNLMEVHEPYAINDSFFNERLNNLKGYDLTLQYLKLLKNKYRKFSHYLLSKLNEIIETLKQTKLFNNSLIIITSDHGQLLGEHNRIGHGVFLYEELLKVPLLIKYPNGSRVNFFEPDNKYYISLINLKPLIKQIIKNNNPLIDDSILYSKTVFSEIYGVSNVFDKLNGYEQNNIDNLNQYRIAIYHNNTKCIFNVNKWMFDKEFNDKICDLKSKHLELIRNKIKKFLKNSILIHSSIRRFKVKYSNNVL